jgi:hypothetical protein
VSDQEFQRFCAIERDDDRLALGLPALEAAWRYAVDEGLLGWQEAIHEYVVALRSGGGLNRPL